MFDGAGLYLEISPAGGKLWWMKYHFGSREKLLSFGTYPQVGLKDARKRRDEAKKLLTNGIDPGAVLKAQKASKQEHAASSFEAVAAKWFEKWKTEVTGNTALSQ
jgi:hypothetical protein